MNAFCHCCGQSVPDGVAERNPIFSAPASKDKLLMILGIMSEEEILRMARGNLNMGVIIDAEFARRFPEAYEKWNAELEAGS